MTPMKELKNYVGPAYRIPQTRLKIDLSNPDETKVSSELEMVRQRDEDLVLDGNGKILALDTDSITLGDKKLVKGVDYKVDETSLTIFKSALPTGTEPFTLAMAVNIKAENYQNSHGFFQVGKTLCTQCESESFRNITYFMDRPDILSTFETTIVQNAGQYPVVLSNGIVTKDVETNDGKHEVTYTHDEPKPPYLFAMVAGELTPRKAEYRYKNGKKVELQVYANPEDESKTEHAMNSVIGALRWYEENYGLVYEQDVLRIVAIANFSLAAMENPTLILFNAKDILADQNSATDSDYMRIDRVIAHEIFHYWAGHRLPIKNWFNFGFKEGLAVMMEELYSESQANLENLILRVNRVLSRVFNADSQEDVHPILRVEYDDPDEREDYVLYEKSAEVFRMLRVIIGDDGFKRSLSKYYERFDTKKDPNLIFDGNTSNFEDFLKIAFNENPDTGISPEDFMRWFTISGVPLLTAEWKQEGHTFTLKLEQSGPGPFVIPVRMSLVNINGESSHEQVLILTEKSKEFTFKDVSPGSIPSLCLGYSAYVKTDFMDKPRDKPVDSNPSKMVMHQFIQSADASQYKGYQVADLVALMRSGDPYASWKAKQDIAVHLLKNAVETCKLSNGDPGAYFSNDSDFNKFIDALKSLFKTVDNERLANMLAFPTLNALVEEYSELDIDTLYQVHHAFMRGVIKAIEPELVNKSKEWSEKTYSLDIKSRDSRKMFNQCFHYLTLIDNEDAIKHCQSRLDPAVNMTEKYAATASLANIPDEEAIQKFFNQYKDDPVILMKWIRAQSLAQHPKVIQTIETISHLKEFNPGHVVQVLALWAAFATENLRYFHDPSGAGYKCLADGVITVAKKDPKLALRLLKFFSSGEKLVDKERVKLQVEQLQRVANTPGVDESIIKAANTQVGKLKVHLPTQSL